MEFVLPLAYDIDKIHIMHLDENDNDHNDAKYVMNHHNVMNDHNDKWLQCHEL